MNKNRTMFKYHPLISRFYNFLLTFRCRNVESYIFVATTGRSGSASLARLFESIKDVKCFHEPYPILYNDCPNGENNKTYLNDLFKTRKRINIRRSAAGKRYYLETNHQFIKNFAIEAIGEFNDKLRIIHLVRTPEQVARSFYRIGSIPGKTPTGKIYLLDPAAEHNFINIKDILIEDSEYSHDIFKCLWYWYEIEARIKILKKLFPNISWYRIRTDELNDYEKVKKMFDTHGVSFEEKDVKKVVGIRKNTKSNLKKVDIPLNDVKSMNEALFDRIYERYPSLV